MVSSRIAARSGVSVAPPRMRNCRSMTAGSRRFSTIARRPGEEDLLGTDMPASSAITQELLAWKPTHPGLIEDIGQGHYFT